MATLELRDVVLDYHRPGRPTVQAVAGVDLSVDRGEIVGLVGETGCGKSSLARVACGLLPATKGTVLLQGAPLRAIGQSGRGVRERAVQMVFQNPYASLNPRRLVGAQIADGVPRAEFRDSAAVRGRVGELLEQVGLTPAVADSYPHQFSGGQRQRIAIARALAAGPSIMVLDEPLSSLDASVQAQVANLLTDLAKNLGVGMLLISHDLAIVRHIVDRVAVMYLGEVVESAPTLELWREPVHPYTRALVAAIPRVDGVGKLPESLPGEVPDPASPPAGCRFHPRCPHAFEKCQTHPTLEQRGGGREVACWLPVRSRS